MERLITVKDVSERYGCSIPTARRYIRQCNPHMEKPLAVTEWAFREWEAKRTVYSPEITKKRRREMLELMANGERIIVPRRRT